MAILSSKESINKVTFSYPLGIDDHYDELVKIAEDPDVCWYCGEKASGTIRCTYSVYRQYNKLFEEKRVKRTYPFRVHICKNCVHKHDKVQSAWINAFVFSFLFGLVLAILYAIYSGFPDRLLGRIIVGLMWGVGFGGLIGILLVAPIVKKIYYRKIVKKELRTLKEHPFIRAMEIYESGVKSKDEYKIMLTSYSSTDVDEDLQSFKEYRKKDHLAPYIK